jgi:hypothetical protein
MISTMVLLPLGIFLGIKLSGNEFGKFLTIIISTMFTAVAIIMVQFIGSMLLPTADYVCNSTEYELAPYLSGQPNTFVMEDGGVYRYYKLTENGGFVPGYVSSSYFGNVTIYEDRQSGGTLSISEICTETEGFWKYVFFGPPNVFPDWKMEFHIPEGGLIF